VALPLLQSKSRVTLLLNHRYFIWNCPKYPMPRIVIHRIFWPIAVRTRSGRESSCRQTICEECSLTIDGCGWSPPDFRNHTPIRMETNPGPSSKARSFLAKNPISGAHHPTDFCTHWDDPHPPTANAAAPDPARSPTLSPHLKQHHPTINRHNPRPRVGPDQLASNLPDRPDPAVTIEPFEPAAELFMGSLVLYRFQVPEGAFEDPKSRHHVGLGR